MKRLFLGLVMSVAACSSNSSIDAAPKAADAHVGPDATPMFSLTVENLQSWCLITVNSGTQSGAPPVMSFAPNTVVHLNAVPESGTFQFGYWEGITLDDGGSRDLSMDADVTMDADKIVKVCCPFMSAPDTPCVGS